MDRNYLYAVLSFLVGFAAGFQAIYERYRTDSGRAAVTLPGVGYLLTRAMVPALVFVSLYRYRIIVSLLGLQALACGAGTELFLRTRIYVKQAQQQPGVFEELLRGPFDLLKWYQSLFLEAIAARLAKGRKRFVEQNLQAGRTFENLCDEFLNNRDAWPDAAAMKALTNEIQALRHEFDGERQRGTDVRLLEERYRLKLGYLVLNRVGKNGLKTLLSS